MIVFADSDTTADVKKMWKICFDEHNDYLDLYFGRRYLQENTLIGLKDGIAAASLQMLPLRINAWGNYVSCSYLAGICTLPQYRKSGLMRELLSAALKESLKRGYALAALIPQRQWLFDIYAKYGFFSSFVARRVELKRDKMGEIASIAAGSAQIFYCKAYELYSKRDALFQRRNLYGLLSKDDFEFAVDESLLFDGHLLSVGGNGWALTMHGEKTYIRELWAEEQHVPALAKILLEAYPNSNSFIFTMPSDCRAFGDQDLLTPVGMARILDVEAFSKLFAKANPEFNFSFEVKDELLEQNNGVFEISEGRAQRVDKSSAKAFSINQVTALLTGSFDICSQYGVKKDYEQTKPYLNLLLN